MKNISELIEGYLTFLESRNCHGTTYRVFRNLLKNFFDWIHESGISYLEVTKKDVSAYIADALTHYSKQTVRNTVFTMKNFYEWAIATEQEGFANMEVPYNYYIHKVKMTQVDTKPTAYLSEEDWGRIERRLKNPRDKFLFNLLYYTGIRIAEAATLRKEDVNVAKCIIRLVTKGRKYREIYLHSSHKLWYLYYEYLRSAEIGEYLFPREDADAPLHINTISCRVVNFVRRIGCSKDISPHSFRKACATRVYYQTKDIFFTQRFMGHSSISTTQKYIQNLGAEYYEQSKENEFEEWGHDFMQKRGG